MSLFRTICTAVCIAVGVVARGEVSTAEGEFPKEYKAFVDAGRSRIDRENAGTFLRDSSKTNLPTQCLAGILRILDDSAADQSLRELSVEILTRQKGPILPAMPIILRLVNSSKRDTASIRLRLQALGFLEAFGQRVHEATEILCRVAGDRTEVHAIRLEAVRSLGLIGPPAASATPVLQQIAFDTGGDRELSTAAITSLGEMRGCAAPALRNLVRHLCQVTRSIDDNTSFELVNRATASIAVSIEPHNLERLSCRELAPLEVSLIDDSIELARFDQLIPKETIRGLRAVAAMAAETLRSRGYEKYGTRWVPFSKSRQVTLGLIGAWMTGVPCWLLSMTLWPRMFNLFQTRITEWSRFSESHRHWAIPDGLERCFRDGSIAGWIVGTSVAIHIDRKLLEMAGRQPLGRSVVFRLLVRVARGYESSIRRRRPLQVILIQQPTSAQDTTLKHAS